MQLNTFDIGVWAIVGNPLELPQNYVNNPVTSNVIGYILKIQTISTTIFTLAQSLYSMFKNRYQRCEATCLCKKKSISRTGADQDNFEPKGDTRIKYQTELEAVPIDFYITYKWGIHSSFTTFVLRLGEVK